MTFWAAVRQPHRRRRQPLWRLQRRGNVSTSGVWNHSGRRISRRQRRARRNSLWRQHRRQGPAKRRKCHRTAFRRRWTDANRRSGIGGGHVRTFMTTPRAEQFWDGARARRRFAEPATRWSKSKLRTSCPTRETPPSNAASRGRRRRGRAPTSCRRSGWREPKRLARSLRRGTSRWGSTRESRKVFDTWRIFSLLIRGT